VGPGAPALAAAGPRRSGCGVVAVVLFPSPLWGPHRGSRRGPRALVNSDLPARAVARHRQGRGARVERPASGLTWGATLQAASPWASSSGARPRARASVCPPGTFRFRPACPSSRSSSCCGPIPPLPMLGRSSSCGSASARSPRSASSRTRRFFPMFLTTVHRRPPDRSASSWRAAQSLGARPRQLFSSASLLPAGPPRDPHTGMRLGLAAGRSSSSLISEFIGAEPRASAI